MEQIKNRKDDSCHRGLARRLSRHDARIEDRAWIMHDSEDAL